MFINCKHCGALVATAPATDLPPERCPRCRGVLRSAASAQQVSVASLLRPVAAGEAAASGAADASGRSASVAAASVADEARERPTPGQAPADAAVEAEAEAEAPTRPPTPPAHAASSATAEPTPVIPAPTGGSADSADHAALASQASPAAPASPPAAVPAMASSRASPSFVRAGAGARAAPVDGQRRALSVALVALALLLGLQIVIADRARLAADPGWRPTLTALCAVLRCSLPPWHEPAALTLLARDVRPDPAHEGRLLAVATFRNDARWAQAWPRLRLTLSDIDGRPVGSRVFAAEDYLDTTPTAPTLAPGHSAQVRLHLREPEGAAVSFAFDFL